MEATTIIARQLDEAEQVLTRTAALIRATNRELLVRHEQREGSIVADDGALASLLWQAGINLEAVESLHRQIRAEVHGLVTL